jgi:hypothetical protein
MNSDQFTGTLISDLIAAAEKVQVYGRLEYTSPARTAWMVVPTAEPDMERDRR